MSLGHSSSHIQMGVSIYLFYFDLARMFQR